jgi:GTP cyclohydrolase I/GTP cyclohydrolase-4
MGQAQTLTLRDVQDSLPPANLALSRAGVSRSSKSVRLRLTEGERVLAASIECFAELSADQKGVHMSRFEEIVNESIEAVVSGPALAIDQLAEQIAREVVTRQRSRRGEAHVRVDYPVVRMTPVTGLPSEEHYRLIASASATPEGARCLTGASAQGMNACPCAQELVQARAEEELLERGFTDGELERILDAVPGATHNQRARGTLLVGTSNGTTIDPDLLIAIIEDAMSSEIYELMKRPDEQWVVEKAHRRPRFVEDSVREMIRGVVERLPELPDDAFVHAHQANFETIHAHDVDADRWGLLGAMRRELAGARVDEEMLTPEQWLRS